MPLALQPTPEAAAMHGFPSAHCRVLAAAVDGDDGYVLLDTGPAEYRYLYGGTVKREDGGWPDGISGNGGGWTRTDAERDLGVVALWVVGRAGAEAVRAAWAADEREAPVRDGVYLFTWWRVPDAADAWPRGTAFRVGGRWVAAE